MGLLDSMFKHAVVQAVDGPCFENLEEGIAAMAAFEELLPKHEHELRVVAAPNIERRAYLQFQSVPKLGDLKELKAALKARINKETGIGETSRAQACAYVDRIDADTIARWFGVARFVLQSTAGRKLTVKPHAVLTGATITQLHDVQFLNPSDQTVMKTCRLFGVLDSIKGVDESKCVQLTSGLQMLSADEETTSASGPRGLLSSVRA